MEQLRNSIFDVTVHAFDTSSVVRLRSSPNFTPDRIFVLPFPVTLITLTLNQRNSRWFDNNYWKSSPKDHPSSFLQLRAKKNLLSWHTVACYAPVFLTRLCSQNPASCFRVLLNPHPLVQIRRTILRAVTDAENRVS